jgi:hypothetical protein
MFQRLLEFRDLLTLGFRKIRVGRDLCPVLPRSQIGIDLSFASLQAPQLIAHGAGVSVTPVMKSRSTSCSSFKRRGLTPALLCGDGPIRV